MNRPVHQIPAWVTTLRKDRLRRVLGTVAFTSGLTAFLTLFLSGSTPMFFGVVSPVLLAGALFAAAAVTRVWAGYGSRVSRTIGLGDDGIYVDGKLRVPHVRVRGIVSSSTFHHLRITTVDETLLLSFAAADASLVGGFARGIHAQMTPGLWELESTRPSPAGGTFALVAFLSSWIASMWEPGHLGFLFPVGLAFATLSAYLFGSGPLERLRIGEDGVELVRGKRSRMRISMRDGLTVSSRYDRIVFSTRERSLSLHLPIDMSKVLANQLADTTARVRDPDATLEVPVLERGKSQAWLSRVKALQGDRYRGRIETPEDLRAIVLDGTRSAAERIYAALRIRSLGGQSDLVQVARDTTVSPRLRVSLDAALTGDDAALTNELEALAEEEAGSALPRRSAEN